MAGWQTIYALSNHKFAHEHSTHLSPNFGGLKNVTA